MATATETAIRMSTSFRILQPPTVHDGDTLYCVVDLGLHSLGMELSAKVTVRLAGLDAPELSTPQGVKVKNIVTQWLQNMGGVGLEAHGIDNYGRVLGSIATVTDTLNFYLLRYGLARSDTGKKLGPWTPEELKRIDDFNG